MRTSYRGDRGDMKRWTHLHLLVLVDQEEAVDLLHQLCPLRTGPVVTSSSRIRRRLDGVDLGGSGWRRVRCQLVFPLVACAVRALLTVLAQVDSAARASHHRPVAFAAVPSAAVTQGDVPGTEPDPLVAPETLLTVEPELAANTLQGSAFVALEGGLPEATAVTAFLTCQTGIDSFF